MWNHLGKGQAQFHPLKFLKGLIAELLYMNEPRFFLWKGIQPEPDRGTCGRKKLFSPAIILYELSRPVFFKNESGALLRSGSGKRLFQIPKSTVRSRSDSRYRFFCRYHRRVTKVIFHHHSSS